MPWTKSGTFVEWFPDGRLDPEFIVSGFFPKYENIPGIGSAMRAFCKMFPDATSDDALEFADHMLKSKPREHLEASRDV